MCFKARILSLCMMRSTCRSSFKCLMESWRVDIRAMADWFSVAEETCVSKTSLFSAVSGTVILELSSLSSKKGEKKEVPQSIVELQISINLSNFLTHKHCTMWTSLFQGIIEFQWTSLFLLPSLLLLVIQSSKYHFRRKHECLNPW